MTIDAFLIINLFNSVLSVIVIWVAMAHYKFFEKAMDSILAIKMRNIFLAGALNAFSLLTFCLTVILPGEYMQTGDYLHSTFVKYSVKLLQTLALMASIYTDIDLLQYYKKMKK
jgi:hypothetical protein